MKANSDELPQDNHDLGDGSYYRNFNIVQKTSENGRIYYEFDQELHFYKDEAVPGEVAAWRLRAVTDIAGLKEPIALFMESLQDPLKIIANNAWYTGSVIRRDSPTIAAFQGYLNMSDADIDNL